MIKRIFFYQHSYFPIPLILFKYICNVKNKYLRYFFLKYANICVFHDINKFSLNNYWENKRSLYWHYLTSQYNFDRDIIKLKTIEKKFPGIFGKNVINIGCGLGLIHKKFIINDLTLIDINKFVIEEIKNNLPNVKIINSDITKVKNLSFNTALFSNGVLMYLKEEEIFKFFKNNFFENIIIINEGRDEKKNVSVGKGLMHNLKDIFDKIEQFNKHKHHKIYSKSETEIFDTYIVTKIKKIY